MDIQENVFCIFSSFIRDLSVTYPEIKNCLYRNYEECLITENKKINDFPKLKSFLDQLQKYEKMITDKDEQFFNLEIEFLEEISFKRLWEKKITDTNRNMIWKYLQTFIIININLKSNADLQKALESMSHNEDFKKENIKDKKTVKDLKKLKKLSENISEKIEEEEENDLENMLGDFMNSGIGEIAKEVAEKVNIEEMFGNIDQNSNPMEIMQQMMQSDKMGSIFQNINSVMEQKKNNGELTEDKLKEDAQQMYNKMTDNPLFNNLVNKMDPNKSPDNLSPENLSPENQSFDNQSFDNKSSDNQSFDNKSSDNQSSDNKSSGDILTKEEKKAKLKQKLKEKENKRVGK